jgi:oxygen-dependent protoporphyrinogen oxidase
MVGRYGDQAFTALPDAALVARVHDELAHIMGLAAPPLESHVQRWPRAMPQYTVGHQARLDRLDAAILPLPGLHVTGAAYRGVGIASCVANAGRIAKDVMAGLSDVRTAG